MSGASQPVRSAEETETPKFDPLRQGVRLPLEAVFYPLGFALELATNSPDVMAAAEENWSGFAPAFEHPPIRLRIAVDEDNPGPCPESLIFRAQRHLLTMISDPANFAVCDLAGGFAFCWFTPATARNRAWLRYFYLDVVVYLILWHQRLTRIHASCVALNGRGLLLCGPSGAGKSCLAYACARRGWTFVSDEATSLVRGSPQRIVLGKPRHIHFRETAVEILPELNGRRTTRNFAGKTTIELSTAKMPGIRTAFQCRAAAVVFLAREESGPAYLVPVSKDEGWRRLEQDLPLFDQPVHEEHKASLRDLLETGVYELRYSGLDDAVRTLEELVGVGQAISSARGARCDTSGS